MDGSGEIRLLQDALAAVVIPKNRCTVNGREIVKDNANAWRYAGEFGDSLRESWVDEDFYCHVEVVARGGGVFLNIYPIPGQQFPFMRPSNLDQERAMNGYHHHLTIVTGAQRTGPNWSAQDAADLVAVVAYCQSRRWRVSFKVREIYGFTAGGGWVARLAKGYPFTWQGGCLQALLRLRAPHHGNDLTVSL